MFNRKALRRAEADLERTQQKLDNVRSWLEGLVDEAGSIYAKERWMVRRSRLRQAMNFDVPYVPLANPFVSKIDESSNAGSQFLNIRADRMKLTPEDIAIIST
jgi:hypothetical protein